MTALLISPDKLKTISYLDANVSNDTIRVAILHIQNSIIRPLLTGCMYDHICRLIERCQIDECKYNCYRNLIEEYIHPIFAYGVPPEISIPTGFKARNNGTIKPYGDNFTGATLAELDHTDQWYISRMQFYIQVAKEYLQCNYECFPEMCCSCCTKPYDVVNLPFNISINRPYRHKKYWQ